MCGISGGIFLSRNQDNYLLINNIVNFQQNRGPDFQDIQIIDHTNKEVIFGHNRLSIFDLSSAAHQPFWDEERKYCITFNGAIYNFQEIREILEKKGYIFRTNSDTEVLLKAYIEFKEKSIEMFNGFFAFAIYDKTSETLFLGRDRFGIKPLFYYHNLNLFCFASTSNIIAKNFNLLPNLNYIKGSFMAISVGDGTKETAYSNLYYLPPGHYATVSDRNGKLTYNEKKYYDLNARVKELSASLENKDDQALSGLIYERLTNAIDLRLKADVPIGVSVSGGLDSTTIAAFSYRKNQNIVGFSYASPYDSRSEACYIDSFNKNYPFPIEYINKNYQFVLENFDEILNLQDAPFESMSIFNQYCVFKIAKEKGVKVLLGGQGADEVFLGYKAYQFYYLSYLFGQQFSFQQVKNILSAMPGFYRDFSFWSQSYLRKLKTNEYRKRSVFERNYNLKVIDFDSVEFMTRQITHYLPTLLRYEDRNSAGNGVESRLPFMDYNLVELGCSLPITQKLKKGYGKWCIREITKSIVPDDIRLAFLKRGFDSYQFNSWLNMGLQEHLVNKINFDGCSDFLNKKIKKNVFELRIETWEAFYDLISLIWISQRI